MHKLLSLYYAMSTNNKLKKDLKPKDTLVLKRIIDKIGDSNVLTKYVSFVFSNEDTIEDGLAKLERDEHLFTKDEINMLDLNGFIHHAYLICKYANATKLMIDIESCYSVIRNFNSSQSALAVELIEKLWNSILMDDFIFGEKYCIKLFMILHNVQDKKIS